MPPCTQYSTWIYKNQEVYGELKIWRGKEKSGTRIPDDKAVKFIFLGTGMTEIMPVPLLLVHLFDHRPFCKLVMPFGHKGCVKQEDFGAIETAKDWLLQRG